MAPGKLKPEEQALWERVIETVEPLDRGPNSKLTEKRGNTQSNRPATAIRPIPKPRKSAPGPGKTLDRSWDRKLLRGTITPDRTIDLHGHTLATAYDRLDRGLSDAIAGDTRVILLITGHAPKGDGPVTRGKIRAAIDDWLAGSRHAKHIAAVRNAHPRHGGRGALYIVLRRHR